MKSYPYCKGSMELQAWTRIYLGVQGKHEDKVSPPVREVEPDIDSKFRDEISLTRGDCDIQYPIVRQVRTMTGIRWPTNQYENNMKAGCLVESVSEEIQFKHYCSVISE
ncbi:hypothetical protein E3N88_42410 [Mikania micrantha]|uniref:Uncharacterized protein n=1 Tax=Mikania micrantha TaxID=192012 RepID=A0A5N6LHU5_9ASTR|nr:hypothetical protein E3N88_42410 [Mikania micrantha]